jgi:hypothetical protein
MHIGLNDTDFITHIWPLVSGDFRSTGFGLGPDLVLGRLGLDNNHLCHAGIRAQEKKF